MNGNLILRCADRLLAVPLSGVLEVFRMVGISARLPRAPRHCLGLVDWHGRLVPVFDLAARLGLAPARSEEDFVDGHLVFVEDSIGEVGYAVDEVRELNEEGEVRPVPGAGSAAIGRMAIGAVRTTDGKLAPLVDHASLLTAVARHQLRGALEQIRAAEDWGS